MAVVRGGCQVSGVKGMVGVGVTLGSVEYQATCEGREQGAGSPSTLNYGHSNKLSKCATSFHIPLLYVPSCVSCHMSHLTRPLRLPFSSIPVGQVFHSFATVVQTIA